MQAGKMGGCIRRCRSGSPQMTQMNADKKVVFDVVFQVVVDGGGDLTWRAVS